VRACIQPHDLRTKGTSRGRLASISKSFQCFHVFKFQNTVTSLTHVTVTWPSHRIYAKSYSTHLTTG
jgi:hypothetical protein